MLPTPGVLLHPNSASLGLDDSLCQSQSQTCPGMFFAGACIELLELDKEPSDVFGTDTDAAVFHFDPKVVIALQP